MTLLVLLLVVIFIFLNKRVVLFVSGFDKNVIMEEKYAEEEKLFEIVHLMSDGTLEMYNHLMKEAEDFQKRCQNYANIFENEANKLGCVTSATLKEYENMMQARYNKNCQHLEIMQEKINNLDTSRKNLINAYNEKEKKVTELKKKISNLEKRRNTLQAKRDQIEAFKLLTNLEFCFEDESVSGYAADKNTKKIRSFNMNPMKLTQKEIIDKLYEIMFDVSSDDQK